MKDRVQIKGLGRLDGDYEFELDTLTNRDMHTIKVIAGLRPTEVEEALENRDNDLVVAFAVIGLRNAGVAVNKEMTEAIWDAPLGAVQLIAGDEEEQEPGDASPPSQTPSADGSSSDDDVRQPSSGPGSRNDGDPLGNDLSPTGPPRSDTSARSALETSRT